MKRLILLSFLFLVPCSLADDLPAGFAVYHPSDLKQQETKLTEQAGKTKSASVTLDKFAANHFSMLSYREASGQAEIHQHMSDLFVVQNGEATLVVGGEVPDAKEVSPGELRGSAIHGGQRAKLSAGDIVHIPPGLPHQLLVDPGAHFTYFVLKIASE
jgi:mannose-6-phosphate isomerase-like protein (cupin superfamily)